MSGCSVVGLGGVKSPRHCGPHAVGEIKAGVWLSRELDRNREPLIDPKVAPAPPLGMPIGERKHTRFAMTHGRRILPHTQVGIYCEIAIVKRFNALIQKRHRFSWRGGANFTEF